MVYPAAVDRILDIDLPLAVGCYNQLHIRFHVYDDLIHDKMSR